MGCCQARTPKLEENFFTVGLCFIQENESQFDRCPVDKVTYRFFQKYSKFDTDLNIEDAYLISDNQKSHDKYVNIAH